MKRLFLLTFVCLSLLGGFSQKPAGVAAQDNKILVIPSEIEGNWFRTDGSGEWVYGFHNPVVIWNSAVYDPMTVRVSNKRYEITIRVKETDQHLYLKPAAKGNLLIGLDPKKMQLFSREPVLKPDYVIPNDEEFQNLAISPDTAICRGFLKGYVPKPGYSSLLLVNHILANEESSLPVTITDIGSFEIKVPMYFPQEVRILLSGRYKNIFLEPGKTTFLFMDLSGPSTTIPNRQMLFMGEGGRINTDLQAAAKVRLFNMNYIMGNAAKMNWIEFRDWCLGVMNRESDSLGRLNKSIPMSKKALQVSRLTSSYSAYGSLLTYKDYKQATQQSADVKIEDPAKTLGRDFYSFLESDQLNSSSSLVAGMAYNLLINAIMRTIPDYKNYGAIVTYLRDSVGILPGLVTDIIYSKYLNSILTGEERPFTEAEEASIQTDIGNSVIQKILLENSVTQARKNEEQRTANLGKTGYFIAEAPHVEASGLFEAIIARYPGKVIFVDFWATWCGPCKVGIERMKPLKEEYTGKDIIFLYITDPSSPIGKWNSMIPDIKGYHYRLTAEEVKPLHQRFNVKTIPRYMLVDKTGKLVNEDLGTAGHSNVELKKLLDEELKK